MNLLFAVRDLMQQRQTSNAPELAHQLKLSIAMVEKALDHWQKRGLVRPSARGGSGGCSSGGCGGCSGGSCSTTSNVTQYQWCGDA